VQNGSCTTMFFNGSNRIPPRIDSKQISECLGLQLSIE
jgi:hypothetical protein